MSIRTELQSLKETDLWGLILFTLFKLKDSDEYSAVSELAYILDKKNMLKLCEYFGGCTITVPTISELEDMIYGLLLYEYVEVDHISVDKALDKIETKDKTRNEILIAYKNIKKVLSNYTFSQRGKV